MKFQINIKGIALPRAFSPPSSESLKGALLQLPWQEIRSNSVCVSNKPGLRRFYHNIMAMTRRPPCNFTPGEFYCWLWFVPKNKYLIAHPCPRRMFGIHMYVSSFLPKKFQEVTFVNYITHLTSFMNWMNGTLVNSHPVMAPYMAPLVMHYELSLNSQWGWPSGRSCVLSLVCRGFETACNDFFIFALASIAEIPT